MTETKISKRAQKTFDLIKAGRFYMAYNPNNPATIKELLNAGLIQRQGRAMVYVAAYVPSTGYIPMDMERFEGQDGYAAALVRAAAPDLLEALKDLANEVRSSGIFNDWPDLKASVEAAIDKAEGRS